MKWNYKENDSTMFCSEFVALAFREAGINKPEYDESSLTTAQLVRPNHLNTSPTRQTKPSLHQPNPSDQTIFTPA